VLDTDELRIRVLSVRLGAASTLALALVGIVYYRATWDVPHRPVMTALACAFGVLASTLMLRPVAPLITGPSRNVFFVVWSAVSTTGIAVLFYLDGAGRSPLAFGFVLALAFAALLYPRRGAIAVAALVEGGYLLSALLRPHQLTDVAFVTVSLLCTAVMCVWTAWWRDRQREELTRLARTDPLTGCLNRRGLEESVEQALAAAAPFGLLTLDLDGLKEVNDRAGHAAGDALLCGAVEALRSVVRPPDRIGRLGGDEFAVILPGATAVVAARIRDRAVHALAAAAPASCGLAVFPGDGATSDELFHRADADVYAAKAQRRGRRGSDRRTA
jgi:diguanylate cyclase (GGDEF)-like protein